MISALPAEWRVIAIHGFVGSRRLSDEFQSPELLLIARRSCLYAGTRFNRRGQSLKGDVANEVETEQIVYKNGLNGPVTTFIQHRGSIPIFWHQDMGTVPQKPPIELGPHDPWYRATAAHFSSLVERYGARIIAFNLVKKGIPGESDIGERYAEAVDYLNQFLSPNAEIGWRWTDIARLRKSGSFGREFNAECVEIANEVDITTPERRQRGIVRVNCVDCLDRTNLTQVAIGLEALQRQLTYLGSTMRVAEGSKAGAIFQKLFEIHGDIIGYQYGGSQLVHTLQSYRGKDPLASKSKDILATISRYYSNTFSDHEKQLSLNVFLGQVHPADRSLATLNAPSNITDFLVPPARQLTDVLGDEARKRLDENANGGPVVATSFDRNYNPVGKLIQFEDIFSFTLARQYDSSLTNLEPIEHETTSEEMVDMKRTTELDGPSTLNENVPFIHPTSVSCKENTDYIGNGEISI